MSKDFKFVMVTLAVVITIIGVSYRQMMKPVEEARKGADAAVAHLNALQDSISAAAKLDSLTYPPFWQVARLTSEMDDAVRIIVTRYAARAVTDKTGDEHRPRIILRCAAGKLDGYVNTKVILESDYETHAQRVRVKWDQEPAKSERWAVSDDYEALFMPSVSRFLEQALTRDTLRLEYSENNSGPDVALFAMAGLRDSALGMAGSCGVLAKALSSR